MPKGKEFRLYMSHDLHTRLKTLAAIEGHSMNRLISDAIEEKVATAVKQGKMAETK